MKPLGLFVGLLLVSIAPGVTTASGEIPITTASEKAREAYIEGRHLAENLRAQGARNQFQRAIDIDPEFALAHLGLAIASTTAPDFWASLEHAVTFAKEASEGERLMILGAEAGAKRESVKQRELFTRLVELHPEDKRAQNLLGGLEFGEQHFEAAIVCYEASTAIDPNFAAPYNMLGYSYRALDDQEKAEAAFRKYVELIPDEPNPYDSYAEFLMKRGRYEESIENYERALEINPYFVPSYIGIANNQIFMGETKAARTTLKKLYESARNDGDRRQSCFWSAAAYVHDGYHEKALEKLQDSHDLAAKSDDLSGMAAMLGLMGSVLLDAGEVDRALDAYTKSHQTMQESDAPDEVKATATRDLTFNQARVALVKGDVDGAKELAAKFRAEVADRNDPLERWQLHELMGLIAYKEGKYETAVAEFKQANQQDPRVLYRLGHASAKAGDHDTARAIWEEVAGFNALNFNYAFVKKDAESALAAM